MPDELDQRFSKAKLTPSGAEKLKKFSSVFVKKVLNKIRKRGLSVDNSVTLYKKDDAFNFKTKINGEEVYFSFFSTLQGNEPFINIEVRKTSEKENTEPIFFSRVKGLESANALLPTVTQEVVKDLDPSFGSSVPTSEEIAQRVAAMYKIAPNALVPNAEYEKLWNQAKAIAEKSMGGKKDDKFWATVTKIYVGKIVSKGMKIPFEVKSESLKKYIEKVKKSK